MTTRSGYSIRIVGFVPTDPSDLDAHAKAIAEISEAKAFALRTYKGDDILSADLMFGRLEVEAFDVKPVTRRAKGEGDGS